MTDLRHAFRANLTRAVEASPLKRYMIASRSGYSEIYIRRILNGTQDNPTLLFVHCIAKALGTTPADLLKETP